MKNEYVERIYSGLLGKIIGIRLGAPIEGWTYDKIKNVYGELDYYPVDYRDFAADDDSNGPLFFLRALEDGRGKFSLTPGAVGEALLNYAPFEHGFFWWGGYGTSTEHTAYLNLRAGIPAPRSGSIEQNGSAVAEQIGGQIFIDTWGLVCPGNPDLAADYAEKAASVTHGGNGVYGGIFIASCIAHAFEERNIHRIIEKGLSYIPAGCEYARVVRAVMDFHEKNPKNWRDCFAYIHANWGYDRYPGNCHIIPNTAVVILGLLYGEGDFSRTITITNMCGWDTDCNVGNAGTIMGVACGLEGIDETWRKPINDFIVCSSVVGSMNIMDIPYVALYIARLAWAIAGEELAQPYREIAAFRSDACHFEYPGSTHAIRVRFTGKQDKIQVNLSNSAEAAHTGKRSLKVHITPLGAADRVLVFKKTHYVPADFHDSRYDPSFSPLLYPGQTVHGSVMLPGYAGGVQAALYVHNSENGALIEGEKKTLEKGAWTELTLTIPAMEGAIIDEAGFVFDILGERHNGADLCCFIDDLWFEGTANYTVDLAVARLECWSGLHREIAQFSRLKGLWYLENGYAHLSCADFGEVYTGHHTWNDYTASFTIKPIIGHDHYVNIRVQGALRSYAAGFAESGKLVFEKNEKFYRRLAEIPFAWEPGRDYTITVKARGNHFTVAVDETEYISYTDHENPYLSGCVGLSTRNGSHCAYRFIRIG
ncbi:MAG: ADP-ribosylglycohydrolase family protein [Treponema sp.]|jgi:ADP-ribosylglycohydrolase|nr:ADP-ribosylglycohydrolase family protein [Treponema sp.]